LPQLLPHSVQPRIAIPNFIAYRNKAFNESDANAIAAVRDIADYFSIPTHKSFWVPEFNYWAEIS
jgi:hypothetical protein